MADPIRTIVRFALQHADSAPLPARIALYHAIADTLVDKTEAHAARSLAHDLEAAQARAAQMLLDFQPATPRDPSRDGK